MKYFNTKALCCGFFPMLFFACTTPANKATKGIAEGGHAENVASSNAEDNVHIQKETACITLEKTYVFTATQKKRRGLRDMANL